ncbi:hypothetical protein [Prosthecobacter sp.]|uniref:hypothetical protein n=1 Tax=Prosthecobacter sp. TaxID=1965333 RepID=UPI001DFBE979|nr:hypothetical protein [Prosthecobacter sp.]MCB1276181.1 hypothetical protein [Prosthecobacter sp.]
MIPRSLLRAAVRTALPFLDWRVPVSLLRGRDRVSGGEVVLLSAGRARRTGFITGRFFADRPETLRTVSVPVWRLQVLLDSWQQEADLTVAAIDRISSRLFLSKGWLTVPMWVGSSMGVPDDLWSFARSHGDAMNDIRRVRTKGLEAELSRSDEDFDLFYDRFYVPHLERRLGEAANLNPRWILRLVLKQGMILWMKQRGDRISGDLITVSGKQMTAVVNGVLDGRDELLREGALSGLYVHRILQAQKLHCSEIRMGGSRPSLHDGVFRYKSKWADALYLHQGLVSMNYVQLLRWNRLVGPVADFLSHTSLIHHDHDGFSALWVFPKHLPLTVENLQREHHRLNAAGLRRFRILVESEPPADHGLPEEVRLIPLNALELFKGTLIARDVTEQIGQ